LAAFIRCSTRGAIGITQFITQFITQLEVGAQAAAVFKQAVENGARSGVLGSKRKSVHAFTERASGAKGSLSIAPN
jgi:hypothetical protein